MVLDALLRVASEECRKKPAASFPAAAARPRGGHLGGNGAHCESRIDREWLLDTIHGSHTPDNVYFCDGSRSDRDCSAQVKIKRGGPSRPRSKLLPPCRRAAPRRIIGQQSRRSRQSACTGARGQWRGRCPRKFTTYRRIGRSAPGSMTQNTRKCTPARSRI